MSSRSLVQFGLCLSALSFFINCGGEVPGWDTGSGGSGTGSAPGTGGVSGSSGGNTGTGTGTGGVIGTGVGGGSANSGGSSGNSGGSSNNGSGGSDFNPDIDELGQGNAKAGETSNVNQAYLKLGEIRILNNNWGSAERNCASSAFSVFVNENKSFGWTFDRAACGGDGSQPDFPQIEFGIHPFGIGSNLATSPEFSSTTLMPIQIKDLNSASVDITNLRIELEAQQAWNITFEFWVSERDPRTADAGVYAELMTFWGWQSGRWPTAPGADGSADGGSGTGKQISSNSKPYTLWVQRDNWAHGWRYFQFRADDGPKNSFSGKLDVKPFIDYLVNERGYSSEFWITRLEVGSEIDDNTKGKVTLDNITFEINNQTRSAVIAE